MARVLADSPWAKLPPGRVAITALRYREENRMPKRIRHCKCAHMPDRENLLAFLGTLGLSERASNRLVSRLLERFPEGEHRHDRSLDYVTAPNADGHQHWSGPLPIGGGQPRVMRNGQRIPVAVWLWERAGNPAGIPLVRTCRDPHCIRPEHHALESASPEPVHAYAVDLAEWDALNPRINYKPKRWEKTYRGEQCLFGHPLTLHGEPKLRQTYCPTCYQHEQARLKRRAEYVRMLDRKLQMLRYSPVDMTEYPHPTDDTLPDVSDQPTLVDMILSEAEAGNP